MTTTQSRPPRTLTEALRTFDRPALTRLLERRPDLRYPLPRDLAELSSRASTVSSVRRALDELNAWQLVVCEALAALPDPSSQQELRALLPHSAASIQKAVADLRHWGLLWGTAERVHLLRAVREYFGAHPGGLAPPSVTPLPPAEITAALQACDAGAQAILDQLLWSPTGALRRANRTVDRATAHSPIDQLLAHQLLRPVDSDTVILPREVAWELRGHRLTPHTVPEIAPRVRGREGKADLVDTAAAGAASSLLHDVELAVHRMEAESIRLLRDGGVGSRDVANLGRHLGTDGDHAAFVLECIGAAGLAAMGHDGMLLPTLDYDRWVSRSSADRWHTLATAWLASPRLFLQAAHAGHHPFGTAADVWHLAQVRRLILALAARATPGPVFDLDSLYEAIAWHRPRATRSSPDLTTVISWTLREATWLGLSSLGAMSCFARAILTSQTATPTQLVALFPAAVDRVIVQADLTAVAPGPLSQPIKSELLLLADQESRGGGGVFRFSAASLRRGFDAGWSRAAIHAWLKEHSTTGVPQPLAYLVDDVSRQHGTMRVGSAMSYLRCTDGAHAATLLAHPKAGALGLRSVGTEVLVAAADTDELVSFLRNLGHAPAVEDERGGTVPARREARAPSTNPHEVPRPMPAADAAASILAVEQRELARPLRQNPGEGMADTLRLLTDATRDGALVHVSYVSADGTPADRHVSPLVVTSGVMRARDRDTAYEMTIPLARISLVTPA